MFFKSRTAYLNAVDHGWGTNKIFDSRCSETAIIAFLKPFRKPLKTKLMKDYKNIV